MDLLTISRRVKSESGRSGTINTVEAANDNDLRIINAVRDAWLDLQDEPRNWRWMRSSASAFALTAGDGSYTSANLAITSFAKWWPESDDYQPRAYLSTATESKWPLKHVEYEVFRGLFLTTAVENAAPQYWTTGLSGELLISPAPDSGDYRLDIDYRVANQELSAGADTPDMPERFHRILIWAALLHVSIADASQEHFVRAKDRYESIFNALTADQGDLIGWGGRPITLGR